LGRGDLGCGKDSAQKMIFLSFENRIAAELLNAAQMLKNG